MKWNLQQDGGMLNTFLSQTSLSTPLHWNRPSVRSVKPGLASYRVSFLLHYIYITNHFSIVLNVCHFFTFLSFPNKDTMSSCWSVWAKSSAVFPSWEKTEMNICMRNLQQTQNPSTYFVCMRKCFWCTFLLTFHLGSPTPHRYLIVSFRARKHTVTTTYCL